MYRMKKRVSIALMLCLCLVCSACLAQSEAWSAEKSALALADSLVKGDYAAISDQADESIKALLTEEVVQKAWEDSIAALGAFQEVGQSMEVKQGDQMVAQVMLNLAEGQTALVAVYNAEQKLVGFQLVPMPKYDEETPLPLPEGAIEEAIALRPGEKDETKGMLTLPKGEGPFPAVVLIHGSGASDMDETVFGMKPFRDLAMGLAEQGIASLRYDKYTFAHQDLFTSMPTDPIHQEYELDVTAAVGLLKADARIDGVYLAGHSEGGMLIPRLLDLSKGEAKGAIILAGSPRSLWEIQAMQNEYALDSATEEQKAATKVFIDAEIAKGKNLANMSESELATETVFGIPAGYHKDLISVDAIAKAKELALPLLILQGGKDFQVSPAIDFEAWQTGLSGADFVSFILYPNLTHLFTPLEGDTTNSVDDYAKGGHVSPEVIQNIATWIQDR